MRLSFGAVAAVIAAWDCLAWRYVRAINFRIIDPLRECPLLKNILVNLIYRRGEEELGSKELGAWS